MPGDGIKKPINSVRPVQSRLEDRTETFVQHIDHRMHALRHCVGKLAKPDYELIKMRYEQEVPVSDIAQQRGPYHTEHI